MAKLRVDKIAAPIVKDEYTGSVFFDGTGDYLRNTTNLSDYQFGTGDFTVEAWIYKSTNGSNNYDGICTYGTNGSGDDGWFFEASATRGYVFWIRSTEQISFNETPNTSQWIHTAVTRKSGVIRLFVNGVLKQERNSSTEVKTTGTSFDIGTYATGTGNFYFNGYISNLRICKGHAVYTGNFTVPTRELEVHTGAKGVVFPAADNRTVLLACQDAYNPTTEATGRHTITGVGNLGGVPGKNLVTNGQFSDGYNGWSEVSSPATFEVTGGRLHVVANSNGDGAEQNVSLVVGVTYILKFDYEISTSSIYDGNGIQWSTPYGGSITGSGSVEYTFTATTVSNDIEFIEGGPSNSADFYIDNVSLVAVPPISEANPGLLRKTNTTSTITETTGSVYFTDPGNEYLSIANNNSDFVFGTGDFTIEGWFYITSSGSNNSVYDFRNNSGFEHYLLRMTSSTAYDFRYLGTSLGTFTAASSTWNHIAVARQFGITKIFVNGVQTNSFSDTNNAINDEPILIGTFSNTKSSSDSKGFNGYVSNFRVCKGHAVYKSNFIPPSRELEVHEGPDDDRTVLLACYDGENIFADKTGRHIIAAIGDRTSSPTPTATDSPIGSTTVTPGLTREVDPTEGPTFGGGVGFVSQNWLTLPKGTSTQRSRGRGLVGGGYISNHTNTIEYIEIHTLGNGQDFGDLSIARSFITATSSSTRCLFHNGYDGSNSRSEIEYVNISTTGNATTFGSSLSSQQSRAGCGNNTRGIVASGSSSNLIEYVTFSTLGNSKDFGDYAIGQYRDHSGCSSPTRGIFAGGFTPTNTNSIQYVTISTVGNSQDFGDLSSARGLGTGAASSATRGVFFGGSAYPSTLGTNIIEYITISTQGNTTDFGDLTRSSYRMPCTSNGTRAVAYSSSPSPGSNVIEYVTIATTGNASDFGDSLLKTREHSDSASSDSHGGIS